MIAEQWRNAYATQKNETANGILQYKNTKDIRKKKRRQRHCGKARISPSGLARNLAPLRAAFCGIGFVFMQRRAVVLRARTRAHLYQRLRHV